ncbi:MAG: lysophospholipid transporter LplT [Herminiimonas sp.]|nr:lysophospholipid transporter LplT [Herminiimonas sp.]
MTARQVRWYARPVLAVLAGQFCAALADNALLILSIALLEARHAPAWITPALRVGFYASYVVLAPFAGRWADAWPKGQLMAAVNVIKLAGIIALALGIHPLFVFAAIGLGAAAYAPARYGILPELTEGRDLVQANAAMEIVTIVGIVGGYLLGSFLVDYASTGWACTILGALYVAGAASTLTLGREGTLHDGTILFRTGIKVILRDALTRNALALTSIFWSAAAVLQFVMIEWAQRTLGLSLAHAAFLPALFAIGMVSGAAFAGTWQARASTWWPPVCGIALGGAIVLMPLARSLPAACALLATTGALAGALLVPMNATLQQRGGTLVLPGLSVAVQNFFENGLSIFFLAAYGAAIAFGVSLNTIIYGLGVGVMVLVSFSALCRRTPAPILSNKRQC